MNRPHHILGYNQDCPIDVQEGLENEINPGSQIVAEN